MSVRMVYVEPAPYPTECEACAAFIERGDTCATAGEHIICADCNRRDIVPGEHR